MILPSQFVDELIGHGFELFTGVPCSYLNPLLNYVIETPGVRYVGAANEGDAVAIAAGSYLGGKPAVAMFQNSGLGNAVNPLTSLTEPFRIPVLLVTTWRGEPAGSLDEPQHSLMGRITPDLLKLMAVATAPLPADSADVPGAVKSAVEHMNVTGRPFAFLMPKGAVAPAGFSADVPVGAYPATSIPSAPATRLDPTAVLEVVREAGSDAAVIATTGYTGRALYGLGDRPNQLYMVGSMGCASSFGLGLALARPDLKVIVLDGDGAALMRLGAFATLGHQRPPNLIHVLLDNGVHESTGAQPTVSDTVNFAAIATASGYPAVVVADSSTAVRDAVDEAEELTFLYCRTQLRREEKLPRPAVTPADVARRMKSWVAGE